MSEELKPKRVKVNGKTITVFKAGFVHGLQRSIRIAEAGEGVPKCYEKLNLSPDVVNYVHRLLYPSLISCSEWSMPTEEEFLKLYDAEANAWIDAAQECNEDWFSLSDKSKQAKEKIEKKDS